MNLSTLVVAGAVALCFTTGAMAQKAGTYSGTSQDGAFISFAVTKNGSVFTFTNANVNFMAACTNPSRVANEGWGFYLGQDIVAGDNDFHSANDYYDVRGTLHFYNNKTIKGTITSVTAVFVPGSDPPTQAQFCKSARQPFVLKWQTAPQRHQAPVAAVLETRRAQ